MLRRMFVIGVFAAAAAAGVPMLYEQNPEAFGAWLRPFLGDRQANNVSARPSRADAERKTVPLSGRKVRVPADARGHYLAEFRLNGRAVEALVDTGATYVAVNRTTARRIGLRLSPSDFRYRVNTANGTTRAAAVTIDTLQIGRIHMDDVQAMVLDDSALAGTLVGLSFLNRLTRFQVEGGALLLEQ